MDFKIYSGNDQIVLQRLEKDSATVIEAGKMVTLDANGLAIQAVAASTQVAFTTAGAVAGTTTVDVVANSYDLVFVGTADAPFAETNRNTEVDLVINSGDQQIDLGASTTDVFKIVATDDAGTVGSALNVKFKINKPLAI